jgi:hypothetical protein
VAIPQKTLAATGTHLLGDASHDTIGSWQVQLTGTWAGDVTFTGWIVGTSLTSTNASGLAYKPMTTGTLTAFATAITANGIYIVPSEAVHVLLNWTRVSGSLVIDAIPLRG